jgi:plastocyanin
MRKIVAVLSVAAALIAIGAISVGVSSGSQSDNGKVTQVTVPAADHFVPFAVTIHPGDSVRWVNNDGDDHTVVSDDAFDTAGHKGTNQLLPADGGTFQLHFSHPGTFVYYCRFHAHLDDVNQPVAPGPDGGIQDSSGNFGTPMSGVVTVVPGNSH